MSTTAQTQEIGQHSPDLDWECPSISMTTDVHYSSDSENRSTSHSENQSTSPGPGLKASISIRGTGLEGGGFLGSSRGGLGLGGGAVSVARVVLGQRGLRDALQHLLREDTQQLPPDVQRLEDGAVLVVPCNPGNTLVTSLHTACQLLSLQLAQHAGYFLYTHHAIYFFYTQHASYSLYT